MRQLPYERHPPVPPYLPPEAQRPLTLRDVSDLSGVSEMTVSRVLRNRADVSPATREKVLVAAKTLGYVPNKIAGALASQRVNLVGVVIPSLSNMVFPEVLGGISAALEDSSLQPVFGETGYKAEREENVIYEMLSWRPSGIIVAGLEHTDAARAMLANSGIPIVEIMDTDGDPIDSMVGISHRKAGRDMARTILDAGYRKIGFLGSKMPDDHRARKRMDGFSEVLQEAGLKLAETEHYAGGSSLAKGREMTQAILSRRPDLDFLYYSNDMIGAGGLLYCLDRGLDVPGQIGLAGFNGLELRDGLRLCLATTDACRAEIGQRAAEIVAGKTSDGLIGARSIELEPRVIPGDTIRAPR